MGVRCLFAGLVVLFLAGAVLSSPDGFAAGAGGTQPVNLNAAAQSGTYGNPALLGIDRPPRRNLSLLLPVPPMSFGLWSNELALPAVNNKYLYDGDISRWLTYILRESFDLRDNMKPDEVSRRLTDGMRDGVGLYFGLQIYYPVVLSMNGFSASLRTYLDFETRLPGGLLLPFFSYDEGLQRGKALDFSTLQLDVMAATELAVKIGRPIETLPQIFDYLRLDKGAYGVGIKHVMGHAYASVSADKDSKLIYDSTSNTMRFNAKIDVINTIGLDLGKFEFEKGYWDKTFWEQPAAGEGWGFDIGTVLHNDNHFVSIDMQDIGWIVWDGRKTRRATLALEGEDIEVTQLFNNFDDFFTANAEVDSSIRNEITYLPMSLNLGYTYYLDFSGRRPLSYLAKYLMANAGLKQQIVEGPGKKAGTMLMMGGSAGLLEGIFPVRYGVIFGGPGKTSSVFSAGFDARYISSNFYYKAVGHPVLMAKKGYELGFANTVSWGWEKKKKKAADVVADREIAVSTTDTAATVSISDTTAEVSISDTADSVLVSDTADSILIDTAASVLIPDTADSALVTDTTVSVLTPDTAAIITTPDTADVVPVPVPSALAPPALPPEPAPVVPPPVPIAPPSAPVVPPPALIVPPPVPVPAPAAPQESSSSEAAQPMTLEEAVKKVNDMLGAVGFVSGTADLTDVSQNVLDEVVTILNKYPGVRYEIRGYVDFDGANAYVSQKSTERADAIKKYIVSKGAPSASFAAKGYGRNAGAGGADAPAGNVVIVPVTRR